MASGVRPFHTNLGANGGTRLMTHTIESRLFSFSFFNWASELIWAASVAELVVKRKLVRCGEWGNTRPSNSTVTGREHQFTTSVCFYSGDYVTACDDVIPKKSPHSPVFHFRYNTFSTILVICTIYSGSFIRISWFLLRWYSIIETDAWPRFILNAMH